MSRYETSLEIKIVDNSRDFSCRRNDKGAHLHNYNALPEVWW